MSRRPATVLVLLVLVGLWLAIMAGPAGAAPDADCPDVAAAAGMLERADQLLAERAEQAETPELMAAIAGEQAAGCFPADHYDLGYSTGGWTDPLPEPFAWLTTLVWTATRWLVVTVAGRLISWAYSFSFASLLAEPAAALAGAYHDTLAGGGGWPDLYRLGLFAAAAWAAVVALRGRSAQAGREFAVSLVVLAAFLGLVVAAPGGMGAIVDRALHTTAQLSGAVVAMTAEDAGGVASGEPPESLEAPGRYESVAFERLAAQVQASLQQAFVAEPYDLLSWGTDLGRFDDADNPLRRCAAARTVIVATGPWGADEAPRQLMRQAGCVPQAQFNAAATVERLAGASLVGLAALIVALVMVLLAVTIIGAQLVAVALVVLLPFAVAIGIVPGGGRQALWRWVVALIKVVATILVVSLFLGLMNRSIQETLTAFSGEPLLVRLGTVVAVTAAMLLVRSRLVAAGQRLADKAGARLAAARAGGVHGGAWMAPAAAGGISGFGIGQLAEETTREARVVPATARRARFTARHYAERTREQATSAAASRPVQAATTRARAAAATVKQAAAGLVGSEATGDRTDRDTAGPPVGTRRTGDSTLGGPPGSEASARSRRRVVRAAAATTGPPAGQGPNGEPGTEPTSVDANGGRPAGGWRRSGRGLWVPPHRSDRTPPVATSFDNDEGAVSGESGEAVGGTETVDDHTGSGEAGPDEGEAS